MITEPCADAAGSIRRDRLQIHLHSVVARRDRDSWSRRSADPECALQSSAARIQRRRPFRNVTNGKLQHHAVVCSPQSIAREREAEAMPMLEALLEERETNRVVDDAPSADA